MYKSGYFVCCPTIPFYDSTYGVSSEVYNEAKQIQEIARYADAFASGRTNRGQQPAGKKRRN